MSKTKPTQAPPTPAETELPEGWALVHAQDVCEINPRKPVADALPADAPVTFVPMAAVDENLGAITAPEDRPFGEIRPKSYTPFAEGDVLFAKITPCMENGKAAVARGLTNKLGFGTTEFHVFRPDGALMADYLYHYIRQQSFRDDAQAHMAGAVGQLRVPADYVKDFELPLPPLPEQKRIVAKVEALLKGVNAARARLAKVPAILKRFRQSVLAAACSGQLTAEWRDYNKTSHDDWRALEIGDLFKVTTGGTPSRKNPAYFTNGTIPWVKTSEVQNCDIFSTEESITPEAIENSSAKVFPAGTLLVALYGEGRTRGQVGRLMMGAATNQACAALVSADMDEVTRRYVFFYLLGQYYELRERSTGGNQPNLSVGLIRHWEIHLPPVTEQREIVRRVEALFARADGIEAHVRAATVRAERLPQAILARAFRGELVPTEAELARAEGRDYEPTSVLLERIQEAQARYQPAKRGRGAGSLPTRAGQATKKQYRR